MHYDQTDTVRPRSRVHDVRGWRQWEVWRRQRGDGVRLETEELRNEGAGARTRGGRRAAARQGARQRRLKRRTWWRTLCCASKCRKL